MILAMDGWIFKLIKTKHRCWLVRGCSVLIASLLFMSCGKKIVDNNKGKIKSNTTNITPKESELELTLTLDSERLSKSYDIKERFFYQLPEVITPSRPIDKLFIYFQVIGDAYEFVCEYIRENNQLIFNECADDEDFIVEHLTSGQEIYLPAGKELFLEAESDNLSRVDISLDIINK